jgi:hypothetical protein
MKKHVLLSTSAKEKHDEDPFFRSEHSGKDRKKDEFFKEWGLYMIFWALERKRRGRRSSFQTWALGRKLNKRRILRDWMLSLIVEDFMNLSCQNRRFVNDQSESKLYEWAETEDLWMIKLNRKRRFYEWIVPNPKICEWSSWIECESSSWIEAIFVWGFLNRDQKKTKLICDDDFFWRFLNRSQRKTILTEIFFRGFQDRNRRKTRFSSEDFKIGVREKRLNSSLRQCEMSEW